jgi:hypothetical protein
MTWSPHKNPQDTPRKVIRLAGYGWRLPSWHRRKRRWTRHRIEMAACTLACVGLLGYVAWDRYTPGSFTLASEKIQLCSQVVRGSCLADGDSGQSEHGRRWRILSIDTPEIGSPACSNEKRLALAAQARLQELMSAGYRLRPSGQDDKYGRALVGVELADGRDAARVLLAEGLAQPWPNTGNVWCGH